MAKSPQKKPKILEKEPVATPSAFAKYFLLPTLAEAIFNIFFAISALILLLSYLGLPLNYWIFVGYLPPMIGVYLLRSYLQESERRQIAHTIPAFTEALSNSLAIGENLEEALIESSYYLKGRLKVAFHQLIIQYRLGKRFDALLKKLDEQFPNTGLIYLVSLLSSYNQLGIGISPLLKKISIALRKKEKAEEKIHSQLTAGRFQAWIAIGLFGSIFVFLGFAMKKELLVLFEPSLKAITISMLAWSTAGVIVIARITSLDYARTSSLKPYVEAFKQKRTLSEQDALKYAEIAPTRQNLMILRFAPIGGAALVTFLVSNFTDNLMYVLMSFPVGYFVGNFIKKFLIEGVVEERLLKVIEIFPEVLQIFIIGLNAGLNSYNAMNFAINAIDYSAPLILKEELQRTRFAFSFGEKHKRTWQRLANNLPFESIIDFAEMMITAPYVGESILDTVVELSTKYQDQKLTLIDAKSSKINSMVIPAIMVAFFPLFLYVLIAPSAIKVFAAFAKT